MDYGGHGAVRARWRDLNPIKHCHALNPTSANLMCTLLEGHIGPHRDMTTGSLVSWPRVAGEQVSDHKEIFQRCNNVYPENKGVYCGMKKDHRGYHRETSWLQGGKVYEWADAGEPQPREITLENEIGDNSNLLEWAKSRNPKLFKTKGRDVASEGCKSANVELHKGCTEPWCDCPCHDLDGAESRTRSNWGICLSALIFLFIGRS